MLMVNMNVLPSNVICLIVNIVQISKRVSNVNKDTMHEILNVNQIFATMIQVVVDALMIMFALIVDLDFKIPTNIKHVV